MTASAQLPVFHVVGFTGHRCLSDPAAVERVLQQVLGELRAQTDVEWLGLSSVAEGADMIFARTARQLQQESLGLIILMLGEYDEIGEFSRVSSQRLMSRLSGCPFYAQCPIRRNINGLGSKRHRKRCAKPFTKRTPGCRIRADAVIHVQGAHGEPELRGKPAQTVQQDDRIDAARQTEQQIGSGGQRAAQLLADSSGQISVLRLPCTCHSP